MGMSTFDLFAYGNQLRQQGNAAMALQIWNDVARQDPMFGPVHINLADIFKSQGNSGAELDELMKFKNCPVTGVTIELLPQVNNRIKELQPKPPPEKK